MGRAVAPAGSAAPPRRKAIGPLAPKSANRGRGHLAAGGCIRCQKARPACTHGTHFLASSPFSDGRRLLHCRKSHPVCTHGAQLYASTPSRGSICLKSRVACTHVVRFPTRDIPPSQSQSLGSRTATVTVRRRWAKNGTGCLPFGPVGSSAYAGHCPPTRQLAANSRREFSHLAFAAGRVIRGHVLPAA